MNFKKLLLVGIICFGFILSGGTLQAQRKMTQIKGSDTLVNLVQILAEAYMAKNPRSPIAVLGGGSGTGIAALINGTCDIANMSRFMKPKEFGAAVEKGVLPVVHVVAMDGIAIIVHPQNQVEGMTLLQLRDFFFGRVWDWRDVGGQAGEIVVISREDGSGTRAVFEELVMKGKHVTLTAVVMPNSQAVVEYVAEHPQAIGYVSMGQLTQEVKVLEIEEAAPTPKSVRQGEYHLFRPLFLITRQEPTGEIKGFIDFVLSPTGQSIVGRKYGRVQE